MKNLPIPFHNSQVARKQDIEYIFVPESESEIHQEKTLGDYLNILKRRKWFIIISFFFVVPIVIFNIIKEKPTYQATTTLLIDDVKPEIIPIKELIPQEKSQNYYNTQYDIIKSREIATKVVDVLQLDEKSPEEDPYAVKIISSIKEFPIRLLKILINPIKNILRNGFSVKNNDNLPSDPPTPYVAADRHRQKVIQQFQKRIQVEPRKETKLVDITLTGPDPEEVVTQVNTLQEVYIQQNLENKLDASRKAISWLQKESRILKEKIKDTELTLQKFKETKQFLPSDGRVAWDDMGLQSLNSLNSTLVGIKSHRLQLQVQIDELNKLSKRSPELILEFPAIEEDQFISSLKRRFLELKLEYANLLKKYTKKHPVVLNKNYEIKEIGRTIRSEVYSMIHRLQKEYSTLLSKEETLKNELNTQQKDIIRNFSGNREYDALKLDLETRKKLYLAVSQRLAESTLTQALTTNNVRVIERALESKLVPRNPKKTLFIIFIGLGMGVGLAFIVEYLDRKFKSAEEVERHLGIPFLGFIPHHKLKDHTGRPITLQAPMSNASEAYRTLRTWLDLSSQTRVKSLLITSATVGEGKSTTAVNLAISFAQLGRTVLLVDTDLRRPSLHRLLRSSSTVGLTDILVNGTDWRQVIQDTDLENLKFLPSGGKPPNPAELLSTKRMKILMGSMNDDFDLVIYDSPVVLSVPEVPILASDMDGVLLVHYPAKGDKEITLESKRIIERTGVTILGIVLNNVKKKEVTYFYSYRYQSHYSYHAPGERQEKTKAVVKFTEMIPTEDEGKWVPESTDSRASETTASTKVEKTSRTENFEITIHEILFKQQIGEDKTENGLCFLILDLSLFNNSEFSYTFNPDLAVIYIDEQNKYDRTLASLVEIPGIADEGNNKEEALSICQYNPIITGNIEEGIVGEEVIATNSVKRGFLVYTIPMEIDKYTFGYYCDDIKITINLK